MVSKIRGKTGISFVPGNVGWPPGGLRDRGVGAPARAAPGPSERPRGDDDPGRPPSPFRTRPHHAPSRAKAQRPLKNGRISFPTRFRFRLGSVSARTEAPSPSATLALAYFFFFLGRPHAMMDNSTVYFGMRRLRPNACGHGKGPVQATGRASGVRTRETSLLFLLLFLTECLHGANHVRRIPVSVPAGPITSRTGRDFVSRPKFRVPDEVSSRARSSCLDPSRLRCCFVLPWRRGGGGEQ
jgi:hypothetical protein